MLIQLFGMGAEGVLIAMLSIIGMAVYRDIMDIYANPCLPQTCKCLPAFPF